MKLIGLTVLVASLSGMAFANEGNVKGYGMTLDELKAKCVELSANQQIKPFKVQVTCSEVSKIWREGQPTQVAVDNSREVGATLRMKGFEVPYSGNTLPAGQTTANCSTLEQFQLTVPAVDIELSCDELTQINNLADFCAPHIDARVQADPGIVLSEPTGAKQNVCDGKFVGNVAQKSNK